MNEHTAGSYSRGCRCLDCTRAHADRIHAYYAAHGKNAQHTIRGDCRVCGERIRHSPNTEPIHRRCKPNAAAVVWQEGPCAWCGDRFTSNATQHRIYCSYRCAHTAGDYRRRAKRAKAPGEFTWAELTRLWLDFGKRCAYCLQTTDNFEPDHVVPLSRGGSNSITNIVPACSTCNRQKRAHLLNEWQRWRHQRGLQPITSWQEHPHLFIHLTVSMPDHLAA